MRNPNKPAYVKKNLAIGHFGKYHNTLSPPPPPIFCISIGRDPFNQNSNRSDREKRTTSKGGPVFSKLFRLDRTDPLSFGPKFPEILVEWIAPIVSSFTWDLQWPHEKTKTMLMQNLGGQTKSIMVFSELAYRCPASCADNKFLSFFNLTLKNLPRF